MPRCLAAVWDLLKDSASDKSAVYATLLEMDKVLGLGVAEMTEDAADVSDDQRAEIEALIAERAAAKKAKDFARADEIRDTLAGRDIVLEDGPKGTTWRKA